MSKPLVDGIHLMPSGAELTVREGLPVSVLFNGADVEKTQEEIEAFTDLWLEDMDESDDDPPDPAVIFIDPTQPTHLYTDANGSRRVVLIEVTCERRGESVPCFLAQDRHEDWPPRRIDGVWYNDDHDIIEATLVSLTPEVEA